MGAPKGQSAAWRALRLVLPACAVMSFAVASNAFTPLNTDLGWMLGYGRSVAASGRLVHTNQESFTEPQNVVVRHDWLVCVGLYQLHQRFGAAGVIAAKWVLVALAAWGLFACTRRGTEKLLLRLVLALVGVHLSWIAYELLRPQLATFVLLAAVVHLALGPSRRGLWAAAALEALWCNLHGGYLVGVVVLGVICAARLAEQRLGWAPTALPRKDLLAAPVVALASTSLTPFWRQLPAVVSEHLAGPARLLDREWIPLWRFGELLPFERVGLALLAGVTVLSLAFLPRRQLRWWALLAFAVASSFSASRHLRIAPILLLPVVAVALDSALSRVDWRRLERAAVGLSALVLLGGGAILFSRLEAALRFIDYPFPSAANAVAVLRMNGLRGNIWNDFDWGGLLLWTAPDSKVAADGRHLAAYSTEMLEENILLDWAPDPLAHLERRKAELVLLTATSPVLPKLGPKFQPLYCDRDACLLSSIPEHLALRDKGLLVPSVRLRQSDFFQSPEGADAVVPLPSRAPPRL